MITSEGSGMHADSIAISKATPRYPVVEMTPMMKTERVSIIFAIIRRLKLFRFVREGIAPQSDSVGALLHFHAGSIAGCSGGVGTPQNGVLREHLAVHLGDQV